MLDLAMVVVGERKGQGWIAAEGRGQPGVGTEKERERGERHELECAVFQSNQ
jgi:hypothetical protein